MRRRDFIAATAPLLVSPRLSRAQGAGRRLGVLAINELLPTMQTAWLDGLRNHGWVEGSNLTIEYRYAHAQDRLPALAAELVALSPDGLSLGDVAITCKIICGPCISRWFDPSGHDLIGQGIAADVPK